MRKKLIIFLIMLIVTIPICAYISTIVHLNLIKEFTSISDINSQTVIQSIVGSEKHLQLYMLLQFLFMLFIVLIVFVETTNIFESKLGNVTDKIKTPFIVGQGQHGTARWLKDNEYEKVFDKNILYEKEADHIGQGKSVEKINFKDGGLVVGYKKKKDSEEIYYIGDNTHSLTVGATRSGKTRTIVLQTIGNLGLAGESMIISDPKGEIYDYTSKFLEDIGYETIVIDFKNPQKSNRYNFLQPVIDAVNKEDYRKAEEYAWDITSSLVGNEDSRMERIWKDGEMSIIAGAIMAVVYENKEHPEFQNLTNVYSFISEMCRTEDGQMPINEYINDLDENNPATRIFNIARIAPEKTRGSFFTSALTTLKLFTSESIYGMTSDSDFSLKDTSEKKRAIYIILPDERVTYYSLASLFVNQQYTNLVEVADGRGGELKKRTNFVLDEFGNFTTIPAFANMLTVGGGRKIRFNIFLQSFAQLEQKYTREGAENILDNCQTWIYLKTANMETATKIMRKLGNYTTSSYSKSSSYNRHQAGSNSESMNLISRPLLTEDEILRIERPYVLVINAGNYPAITKIPDLSKWRFNKLYGLGDKEHNRAVREERENSRKVRELKKMQLWGVWNEYR